MPRSCVVYTFLLVAIVILITVFTRHYLKQIVLSDMNGNGYD